MVETSLFHSEKNTLPEYATLGMVVIQLILHMFQLFLKLKKRVANNETRLQSMRNRIDRITGH